MTGSKLAVSRVCWIAAIIAAMGLLFWTAGIARGGISECVDATCRVTAPDGGRGTGCVFEIQRGAVYVLTAAHVVGEAPSVECEFWRQGHQSQPLVGRVTARSTAADAAIVAVAEAAFAGRLPAAVPLAPRTSAVRPGQTLASVGCANGAWSTAWKGHALGCRDGELRFVPVPANGRSGSALFDAEGQEIIGLVQARTGDNSEGIAATVQSIYRAFDAPGSSRGFSAAKGPLPQKLVQCGPGGCPLGGATPGSPQGQGIYRLLPYRQNLDRQVEGLKNSGGPWPTLPLPPAAAPPPVPAAPAGPDLSTVQALGELGRAAERNAGDLRQLRDEVLPRAIDQAVKPMAEKISAIDQTVKPMVEKISAIDAAVKPLEQIKDRLDADIAAGGLKGKLAQRIEDLASGKTETGDPHLRLILITLGVAGVAAAIAFKIIRDHQGTSALGSLVTHAKTAVDATAAKVPALAPAAAGLDAVGSLILNQLNALQSRAAPVATPAAPAAAAAPASTAASAAPAATH
ncbi:MAG: trypsin-like peptidase domain-containing protein [Thermoguttaceae bacterium]|jgi:hypothetical protein